MTSYENPYRLARSLAIIFQKGGSRNKYSVAVSAPEHILENPDMQDENDDIQAEYSNPEAEDSNPKAEDHIQPTVDWYISRQQKSLEAIMHHFADKEPQNWTFSPYSLMCCLAMVAAGGTVTTSADGISKNACEDCEPYCFPYSDTSPLPRQTVLNTLKLLATQLTNVLVCRYANIVVQPVDPKDQETADEYKKELREYFQASSYPTKEYESVNAKVREITTLPVNILPREPSGTCVINCIYLKDEWLNKFEDKTQCMHFKTSKAQVDVNMMETKQKLTFVKHGSMIAVCLPYKTPGMRAWFVKGETANDADAAIRKFLPLNFGRRRLSHQRENFLLQVPKFKIEKKFDIRKILEGQGVKSIFKQGNLQKMSGDPLEFITEFEQVCMLKVDQEGTVAAAVSVGTGMRSGPKYKELTFAHTFFMLIEYQKILLFASKIDCPDVIRGFTAKLAPNDCDFPDSTFENIDSDYVLESSETLLTKYAPPKITVNVDEQQVTLLILVTTADIHDKAYEAFERRNNQLHYGTTCKRKIVTEVTEENPYPVVTYQMRNGDLTYFAIQNVSTSDTSKCMLRLVYEDCKGEKDDEEPLTSVKKGDAPYQIDWPTQLTKEDDSNSEFWLVKDRNDKTVLKVVFQLDDIP